MSLLERIDGELMVRNGNPEDGGEALQGCQEEEAAGGIDGAHGED